MSTKTEIIEGFSAPGKPAPLYEIEYIETGSANDPLIVSVHTAMGQRLDPSQHPRFRYWLLEHKKNPTYSLPGDHMQNSTSQREEKLCHC